MKNVNLVRDTGKRNRELLREQYGLNKNPNFYKSDRGYEKSIKATNRMVKYRKQRTKVLRYIRKATRDMIAKRRSKLRIVAFGYWKYWFLEGKIGPEETNEPMLVHGPAP